MQNSKGQDPKSIAQGCGCLVVLVVALAIGLVSLTGESEDTVSTPQEAQTTQPIEPLSEPNQEAVKTLGVTKTYLQNKFSHPDVGFSFEDSPLADGTPRVLGTSPNSFSTMEIYGPEDEITKATLISVVSTDPNVTVLTGAYNFGLTSELAPGPDWETELVTRFNKLAEGSQKEKIATDNALVSIELHEIIDAKMLLLTIEPKS